MNSVEIYTRTNCSFSTAAKRLLARKGVLYTEIDVSNDPALRTAMTKRANGGNTLPQIFIGGKHVGGCDDLYALDHRGGLDPLLAA